MTVSEKRTFVLELVHNVQQCVLDKVSQMPDEWDGHELRRYLADAFEEASITLGRGCKPDYRARNRRYKQAVLEHGL